MCLSGATCVASSVKTQELSSCGASTLTSHNNKTRNSVFIRHLDSVCIQSRMQFLRKSSSFISHMILCPGIRIPTLFCPRNSRYFQGVFKYFLHFFKVSLNIPNELRDSLNQSLNIKYKNAVQFSQHTLYV